MFHRHPHPAVGPPAHPSRRRVAPALPPRVLEALAAALLRDQVVTPGALETARQHAGQHEVPLHEALVALGFVEEHRAYADLARAAELPFLQDPRTVVPSPLAIKLVPERVARRHELIPFGLDDRHLSYLTATPCDVEAERDLAFTTGRRPVPTLTGRTGILAALERVYPVGGNLDVLLEKAGARAVVEKVDDVDAAADSAVIEICNTIIARAVEAGASDIHLDPERDEILVRFRVGGVLEAALTVPAGAALLIRNRLKIVAGADIAVRHRPQDGAFGVRVSGRRIDVRLSTLPTTSGEKIVMRIIDSQSGLQALDTLGYEESLLARFARALDRPDGLVLVTGPTGSGKTTALYAALHHLRNGRINIISVEDPVERALQGVNQIPVNARAGATFANVLRSVLRQDPDVLMVGEIRDAEVAGIVGQAAYTGHLVLTSVHTIDAASAVTRLLNLGLEPFRIAESLSGILAQRLVRRLCPGCRTRETGGYVAGAGCPHCHNTGFLARVPVAELLTLTDHIREVIAKNGTATEIRLAMRQAGIPSMRDAARRLVREGTTSVDEVARVLGAEEEGPAVVAPFIARRTVLVADDEPITRTLVRVLLDRAGYTVIEAATGREAVDLASQRHPDLILMDLNMPQMDGYDAIGLIRSLPDLVAVPIVVVTADDGARVESKVLALGADDYIVKPFEPAVLDARVKAAFERHRLAVAAA